MKSRSGIKIAAFISAVFLWNHNVARAQEQATSGTTSGSIFTKEKWGVSYLNYMNGPAFSESNGGSINHYLTVKHKFSPDWGISFVLRPDSNFGNGENFVTMDDSYLRLEYPAIYKNDTNNVKITGDFRYYIPMGKASRDANRAGTIQTRLKANAEAGKFSFEYIFLPKIHLNTQATDGQKVFSHGHWFGTSYKLFSKFKIDFALYPEWVFKQNAPTSFNDLLAYPGFTVDFTDKLSLSPYVEIPLLNAQAKGISVGGVLSYTVL